MSEAGHVLIVDDEPNVRRALGALLEQAGHTTRRAASAEEALALVRAQDPDLVITDLRMGGMDGMELLARLRAEYPEIPVVLLTAHGTIESAVEAMKRGAFDYLTKPWEKDRVLGVVARALGQGSRAREEFLGPFSAEAPCGLVGRSEGTERVREAVRKVAPVPTTVLLIGETGTGKELVADAIHRLSPRSAGPMIRINCGALPENLVESELFGVEKGAFTGADRSKPGRFELADGGTLFLDEVGDLHPAGQVKLLRVLQDGAVQRLGGTEERRVDVRLVAATHRDLREAVAAKGFREDLYYRLRVVEIRIPPLRERREDVPLLAEFFLEKHARRLGRSRPSLAPEAVGLLAAQPWPGNVRELENAIERAMVFAAGDVLGPGDLGLAGGEGAGEERPSALREAQRSAEDQTARQMIRAALAQTGGNVTRAAEVLGYSRRGLQLRMRQLGMRGERPGPG